MSETAPEPARGKGGNVFTNRIGPLPMWAWVAVIGGVIIAWSFYKNKTSAASTAADTTGTSAADVPQFVNQTYTTVQAPAVQDDQDTGPAGPPGPPGPAGPPVKVFPPFRPPVPAPRPHPPVPHVPIFNATYIVRKGDTLNTVAKKFHVTREELAHANGYGTGAGLRTGEHLKVPHPAGYGSPNKAP